MTKRKIIRKRKSKEKIFIISKKVKKYGGKIGYILHYKKIKNNKYKVRGEVAGTEESIGTATFKASNKKSLRNKIKNSLDFD